MVLSKISLGGVFLVSIMEILSVFSDVNGVTVDWSQYNQVGQFALV